MIAKKNISKYLKFISWITLYFFYYISMFLNFTIGSLFLVFSPIKLYFSKIETVKLATKLVRYNGASIFMFALLLGLMAFGYAKGIFMHGLDFFYLPVYNTILGVPIEEPRWISFIIITFLFSAFVFAFIIYLTNNFIVSFYVYLSASLLPFLIAITGALQSIFESSGEISMIIFVPIFFIGGWYIFPGRIIFRGIKSVKFLREQAKNILNNSKN